FAGCSKKGTWYCRSPCTERESWRMRPCSTSRSTKPTRPRSHPWMRATAHAGTQPTRRDYRGAGDKLAPPAVLNGQVGTACGAERKPKRRRPHEEDHAVSCRIQLWFTGGYS